MKRATWHDAYDGQMGLWRWYRTPWGQKFLDTGYGVNAGPLVESSRLLLKGLYRSEPDKLLTADPVFVSGEMGEVIQAATEGFQPEPLYPTDLLTPQGFCWYERPFLIPDRFDDPLSLRAWSWCPMKQVADHATAVNVLNADDRHNGMAIALYGGDGTTPEYPEGIAVTLYADWPRSERAPLGFAPAHMTPWWFGMTFDGNEVDENGNETGAAWWWRLAQVTLRLMQQRIAVHHRERPDRPSRREGQRLGFDARGEREILVVRLRREQGERHDPSGEAANYSHRFIVGGHWRNQWYPSSQIHRQIWISPYVKGPDDKPLVVKPRRAFTWDR
jgi:hypothetical protein